MSNSPLLTVNGFIMSLWQWSKELSLDYDVLRYRHRKGWNAYDILFKPIGNQNK